ncbi:hypothetical protein NL676_034318 [Syzygium grande]|nr:hypothetical protein NL676_034318 [Syzygium grande]
MWSLVVECCRSRIEQCTITSRLFGCETEPKQSIATAILETEDGEDPCLGQLEDEAKFPSRRFLALASMTNVYVRTSFSKSVTPVASHGTQSLAMLATVNGGFQCPSAISRSLSHLQKPHNSQPRCASDEERRQRRDLGWELSHFPAEKQAEAQSSDARRWLTASGDVRGESLPRATVFIKVNTLVGYISIYAFSKAHFNLEVACRAQRGSNLLDPARYRGPHHVGIPRWQ